jgi:hypothetical protein
MILNAANWLTTTPLTFSSLTKTTSGQVPEIKKSTGYIVLPAFNLTIEATLHSRIVAQFLYQASRTFSLELTYPQANPFGFTLAIRWRSGNDVWRRKLYTDEYFVSKVYNQERIHRNFVLEVWTHGVSNIVNPSNLNLKLSTKSTTIAPLDYFLECGLANVATLATLVIGTPDIALPNTPNALGPWLTNSGQWAEIGASSSQLAANKFPAGFP